MNEITEILKYLVPSLIVFITVFMLVRVFLNDLKKNTTLPSKENDTRDAIKIETHKALFPLKLQAYERITLLLERINPESLIMRTHKNGMTALDIQRELLRSIREEFDHNLSQQIYVNTATWEAVKNAKDEMTKLVKLAGSQVEISASAIAYSETFLKMAGQLQQLPTQVAIEKVKAEMKTVTG